ncbi:MAG TPA: YceI family protein [Pseudonocardia sp.]|jgi:polyisoprenoid-binding protein YceI|nr:YceI family protein [Pseudonocardia sp.]
MSTAGTVSVVAGTWDIDPVHSDVSFAVRHMMVSKVKGRFGSFTGEIVTNDDIVDSSVTVSIDLSSVDTNNEQRDGHLKSADFLDVATYPTMTYRSTGVRGAGDEYVVDGELSLHGVTRSVPLQVEVSGSGPDAYGGTRVGFSATATISRADFGIDISMPLDGGGVVVGDKIQIAIEIEGVLRAG